MLKVSLAKEHLNQAVHLLSATTVVAVFYTLEFALFCLLFRLSCSQLWDHNGKIKRQTVWTLILATVLLICATLDVIVSNRHAVVAYIYSSTLPDGPLGLQATLKVARLIQLDGIVNIVEDLLILGVLVSLHLASGCALGR
jgi:hypothetical protein